MARDLGARLLRRVGAWDRHTAVDVLVAAVLGVTAEVEALIDARGNPLLLAQASVTGLVLGGLVLGRRRRPLLMLTVLMAIAVAGSVLQALLVPAGAGTSSQVVPLITIMVMSYSLGAFGSRRDLLLGLPQPLIVVTVIDSLQPSGHTIAGAVAFFAVALVGLPALAGRLVRGRQRSLELLADQRRELEVQRAMQTRTAQATERLQLAGRLQADVVAGMNVLLSQAAAVQHEDAAQALTTVAAIEVKARALLADTRKVVVSLASSDSAPGAGGLGVSAAPGPGELPGSGRPAPPARRAPSTAAMAWTAVTAAAVAVGLLVQVRTATAVHVAMPVAIAGCLVIVAPLAVFWRRPLAMAVAVWAGGAVFSAFVTPLGDQFYTLGLAIVPPFLVAYFEYRRRTAIAGLEICLLGGLLCFGWDGFARNYEFVATLAAWIAGRVLVNRARMVEELRSNNQQLAGQQEASLRHAVAEERTRIARELHDSIGHYLTIMALQAGAARRLWAADSPKAKAALAIVAKVAAQGVAELRLVLGGEIVLARDAPFGSSSLISSAALTSTAPPASPAPPTSVAALLDNARAAGLPVNLHMEADLAKLPGAAELALFRVLQESLTNILRHAPGSAADVTVRDDGSRLELVVSNSRGERSSAWADGRSHGQRGMRQRVEECGGNFESHQRADGGFEVRACFPIPER